MKAQRLESEMGRWKDEKQNATCVGSAKEQSRNGPLRGPRCFLTHTTIVHSTLSMCDPTQQRDTQRDGVWPRGSVRPTEGHATTPMPSAERGRWPYDGAVEEEAPREEATDWKNASSKRR